MTSDLSKSQLRRIAITDEYDKEKKVMKLEIDYEEEEGRKATISNKTGIYGTRMLILPERLAIEIYNQLSKRLSPTSND